MTRRLARKRGAGVAGLLALACHAADAPAGAGPADAAIQQTALAVLFTEREHDRAVVLWADTVAGPVFATLGTAAAPLPPLALRVPVTRVTGAEVERLFGEHPDGWAAFYARYPGSGGLVEVARPTLAADDRTARVTVGRSCGEHCRQAWRVTLARSGGGWRVTDVARVALDRES